MTFWFNKKKFGNKIANTKSISISYHFKHRKSNMIYNNGAVKGNKKDSCFDLNIHIFGLFISYTDWNYNSEYRETIKEIRNKKLIKINKKSCQYSKKLKKIFNLQ